jgi:hypothetical protein
VLVPGRGEVFVRRHHHADPTRPTLLLLHGWTASADLQFFTAYETLAEHYSFVAVDHHGHGRGIRTPARYELEHAADDAAAWSCAPRCRSGHHDRLLDGRPDQPALTRRHPELVCGIVVQATVSSGSAPSGSGGGRSGCWVRILRSWAIQPALRIDPPVGADHDGGVQLIESRPPR